MTGVFITTEGHLMTEAEIRVMQSQTKKRLEAPEAGIEEGSSPTASREAQHYQPLAFRAVRKL